MEVQTTIRPETLQELQEKVAYTEAAKQIINKIHSANDLDHILVNLRDEILKLFDAEQLTLYVVDAERREIYSKYLDIDKIHEIRVPISEQSISGFVAKYRRPLNIGDAYSRAELNTVSPALIFDSSWDKKTGFRTKQILTYPIVAENKYLMGVLQLVNKKGGDRFTKKDEESVAEISRTLGIAFFNQLKLSRKTPTKFDYLVANSRITHAELEQAVAEARKGQIDIETLLMDRYKIPKAEIGKSLSLFYKCPFVEYDGKTVIDPELLKNLNADYLKKNYWVPLRRDKDGVEVLIDDPNDLNRVQDIRRIFPARSVRFAVGLRREVLQFVFAATGEVAVGGSSGSIADIMGELVSEAEQEKQEESTATAVDENDSA
ncbi:MAG TPA: GAF domain-containing protein, partial [Candidatus Sulfotelmatobacter sp.]|nr:GAF domain-containing protein [Candidatus Sulfotelmatobacter sp.]